MLRKKKETDVYSICQAGNHQGFVNNLNNWTEIMKDLPSIPNSPKIKTK